MIKDPLGGSGLSGIDFRAGISGSGQASDGKCRQRDPVSHQKRQPGCVTPACKPCCNQCCGSGIGLIRDRSGGNQGRWSGFQKQFWVRGVAVRQHPMLWTGGGERGGLGSNHRVGSKVCARFDQTGRSWVTDAD